MSCVDAPPQAAKKGVVTCLAALAFVLVAAPPAAAHAELISASPAPGTALPQAPGAVVLRFNEPLNMRLSEIRVLDSEGRDVAEGPTVAVEGNPQAMRRELGLLPADRYLVEWTSVSTLDGHALHGSYRFGVGTAAAGDEVVRAGPVDSEGWLGLMGRYVALVGLALWAGSALMFRVARAQVPEPRLQAVMRAAPWLVLAGIASSLVSSAVVATGSPAAVGDVVFGGRSGFLRLVLMVTAGLGAALGPKKIGAQRALVAVALVAEAASGHAASSTSPVVATISFAVHLGAVGVWVFAVVASVLSTERLISALRTFTRYAVGAAAAVALSGLVNATISLADVRDLVATGYGRVLALKMGIFVVMAGLGLTHYLLRRAPRARSGGLKVAVRSEMVAGALALALATALVGFPSTPGATEAADVVEPTDLAPIVEGESLSIAEASGPFIVGLTLSPPAPGEIVLRVDVLGAQQDDELRDGRAVAQSADGSRLEVPLSECGVGCFDGRGVIDAEGRWLFEVSLSSNRGPVAMDATVPLPAPDGGEALDAAIEAMEELSSARVREELRGEVGGEMVVSRFAFQAPDRMSIATDGSRQVVIGEERYRRPGPEEAWEEGTWPGEGFTWPQGYYRSFWHDPQAVRVLGTRRRDGERYRVISFVRPELPAWFRLWADPSDHTVRFQEMRAEGHIMDHVFGDFDAPIEIRPPR